MTATILAFVLINGCAAAKGDGGSPPGKLVEGKLYPADSKLLDVSAQNPHSTILAAEVHSITKVPDDAVHTVLMHGDPKEIQGKGILRLFPDHRFYLFTFSHRPASESRTVSGLLWGMHYTIAVGKDNSVFRLHGCASFGEFLAQEKVRIRNVDEARLVSDAYSEIYRTPRAKAVERVAERQWRFLVPTEQTGIRCDVLVDIDEQSVVRSTEYRLVSPRTLPSRSTPQDSDSPTGTSSSCLPRLRRCAHGNKKPGAPSDV